MPLTRRKGAGNLTVFKPFQRSQRQNRSRPPGLKENTRLKVKMLDKAESLALRCFTIIRMFSFKQNCIRLMSPDPKQQSTRRRRPCRKSELPEHPAFIGVEYDGRHGDMARTGKRV